MDPMAMVEDWCTEDDAEVRHELARGYNRWIAMAGFHAVTQGGVPIIRLTVDEYVLSDGGRALKYVARKPTFPHWGGHDGS